MVKTFGFSIHGVIIPSVYKKDSFIELHDGEILTGNPNIIFDGSKNPWVSYRFSQQNQSIDRTGAMPLPW